MRLFSIALASTLLLLPAAGAAQTAVTLPAPGTVSAPLGELELRYVRERLAEQPTYATQVGVHAYDDRLPDLSPAGYARRAENARRWLADLDAFRRRETLVPVDAADVMVMRASFERTLLDAREQSEMHNPSMCTGTASSAIYSLISREFAPLADRLRSAIAREQAIPAMVAACATNITTVDPTTAMLDRQNIAGAVTFFRTTVIPAFASVNDPALQASLAQSNAAVISALTGFQQKMEAGPFAHPTGTFAIGADAFTRRLEVQEAAPLSLAEYEAVGQRALDETKAQFIRTAAQIDPRRPAAVVYAQLGQTHPSAQELIPTAQRELDSLRAFVASHDLLTLAPEWNVKVADTPIFNRQTSLASMSTPGALEKVATQAYYYVTVPEASWTPAQRDEHLSFYNSYAFPIISAHEVMPGHYENFVWHKFTKLSLVAALASNPSYSEGWAHYDEQMMVDEGWGNGAPQVRLAQLALALQREARYLVGLREHTQGMSVDVATRFFVDNAFLPEIVARREALRGTQDPLYGYYTLGKLEILKLRNDYKNAKGNAYTLKGFHDAFLSHGNLPIGLVRKLLLGPADDGKIL